MPYAANRLRPQLVIVDARVNGQQVVNTFYLRHSNGTAGSSGTSTAILAEFRDAYRLLLNGFWSTYQVQSYTMREINDAILKGVLWENVFDPFKVDSLAGNLVDDVGQLNAALEPMMPTHEALRVRKYPGIRTAGYHRAAYNRFAPWSEVDHSNTEPERWTAAFIAGIQPLLSAFNATSFDDGGIAPTPWFHSVYSATLYGRLIKPTGGPMYIAGSFVAFYTASVYVGTQITRRFSPVGFMHGA
jgi:hypothetical protein